MEAIARIKGVRVAAGEQTKIKTVAAPVGARVAMEAGSL